MFGRSQPICPVDDATKEWVEQTMRWLTANLGAENVRCAQVILPTERFFPFSYEPTPKVVLRMLKRVCRFMDVDHRLIRLKTFKARELVRLERRQLAAAKDTTHHYFWFEDSLLDDAFAFVGALARDLALVRLKLGGWMMPQTIDSNWRDPQFADLLQAQAESDGSPGGPNWAAVADLLTVLLGMGVFTANTVMIEKNWHMGHALAGWSTRLLGTVSMETYGYALALFAWYRGEQTPRWAEHLRGTAETSFNKGLNYLNRTGDSLFQPSR
jgi:hypothetical protein